MKFSTTNIQSFEDWRYNLLLIAPTKGEAKKTVSRGYVRVEVENHSRMYDGFWSITGYATDDILSVSTEFLGEPEGDEESRRFWVSTEDLKKVEPSHISENVYTFELPEAEVYDTKFDQLFWHDHVRSSIYDVVPPVTATWLTLSPDRLRKFSLLKPQGHKLYFDFVEWSDRDVIRWSYDDGTTEGVYVPVDMGS